jgi:ATP-dependent RNA helicase DeaD
LTIEGPVAGTTEGQVETAAANALLRLGWLATEGPAREAVTAIQRGGNVVAVVPPSPAWGDPVVAALLGDEAIDAPFLILAAPASVGEWAVAVGSVIEAISRPRSVTVLREAHRAARVPEPPANIVIASPASALASHERSALQPERFRAILFAWPEYWHADDAVAAVLQDCSREAQRVVLTTRANVNDGANGLIERYARKAVVVGAATAGGALVPAPGSPEIRTVPTSWAGRAQVTAQLLGGLGCGSVTIWTADTRDHPLIRRAMGSLPDDVRLAVQSAPGGGTVICYDVPAAAQLAAMGRAEGIWVLVPPGTEEYVSGLAPVRRPISLESRALAVADHDAALRQQLIQVMERDNHAAALYALAPLFEQSDPQLVAAALFSLWQEEKLARIAAGTGGAESGSRVSAPVQRPAMLWIGAGKRDEATVGDFVAVLVKEAGMDRSQIGRIELRDTFALVEVPADQAEEIAQRLAGVTIRKRRLMAKVDRGRGKDAGGRRG